MADTTVDASTYTSLQSVCLRVGPVWIDENTAYVFYSTGSLDVVYRKTADGGANWAAEVTIRSGTVTKVSVSYDKWAPGDPGSVIHIAYLDTGSDDILYRPLDTSDDSLGTERIVFDGATFPIGNWANSTVDITKARGGNLYIGFWGDADSEYGFFRSTDSGVNWTSRARLADGNEPDRILLMPGNEADNQDIWCIYWDASANELSLKTYDDSADSWSETIIASSMSESFGQYQMSAAPRHSDNHIILAIWSALATATSDLKVWDINGSGSITAKADVVTDLDESAGVALLINQQNDDIYVAYLKGGTWGSLVDVKYKKSADGGASWGAEQTYSEAAAEDNRAVWAGISVGDAGGKFQPMWFDDDDDDLFVNLVNDVDIAAVAVGDVTITVPVATLTTSLFAPVIKLVVIPPTRTLSLATFVPVLGLSVIPPPLSLSLTAFAPTVTATANVVITPPVLALSLNAFAPAVSVSDNQLVTPPTLALSLTIFAPTVSTPVVVTPPVVALSLTAFAPTVTATGDVTITVPVVVLSLTAFAPAIGISDNQLVTPGVVALILSAFVPTVSTPVVVTPGMLGLNLSVFAPTVTVTGNVVVTPGVVALSLSLFAPTVLVTGAITVTIPVVALSLTTFAPVVFIPAAVWRNTGSVAILLAIDGSISLPGAANDGTISVLLVLAGSVSLPAAVNDATISIKQAEDATV